MDQSTCLALLGGNGRPGANCGMGVRDGRAERFGPQRLAAENRDTGRRGQRESPSVEGWQDSRPAFVVDSAERRDTWGSFYWRTLTNIKCVTRRRIRVRSSSLALMLTVPRQSQQALPKNFKRKLHPEINLKSASRAQSGGRTCSQHSCDEAEVRIATLSWIECAGRSELSTCDNIEALRSDLDLRSRKVRICGGGAGPRVSIRIWKDVSTPGRRRLRYYEDR